MEDQLRQSYSFSALRVTTWISGIVGLLSSVNFLIVLSQVFVSSAIQLEILAMILISFVLGIATLIIATKKKNQEGGMANNFIKWGRILGIYNIAISVVTFVYLLTNFLFVLEHLTG